MHSVDGLGLPCSFEDAAVLADFDALMTGYLASSADVMDRLDDVLTREELPIALCFRGYLLKMASNPRLSGAIDDCLARLQGCDLTAREQAHVAALTAWHAQQADVALSRIETILDEYPRDILALRIAHHLHFYNGEPSAMRQSVEKCLPAWSEKDPLYGFVVGMYSFALEESAEYREAEIKARQACDLNPGDIWAGHAMAHCCQMQGRWIDGLEWMEVMMPNWQDKNNFVNHLHWHQALFHLGRYEYNAALAIYDEKLERPLNDDFYLDACNAASLLWRLDMAGVDTGERWRHLSETTANRIQDDELVFCSLHYLMAPAVLHDQVAIDQAMSAFTQWSEQETSQGQVCQQVGLDLAQAIVALGRGQPEGARLLARHRRDTKRIGGSWAQRELFKELQEHYG
jgi:tetratricopeptide (TPR) repeat protein